MEASILIVESSLVERERIRQALKIIGFTSRVDEAGSVNEAQKLVSTEKYQICFIGCGLSEETQLGLLKAISDHPRENHCALIPLSKHSDRDRVFAYIKAGAHGVLLMPIQPDALKRVIETSITNAESSSHLKSVKDKSVDNVNNLAWILDYTAERLRIAANKIKNDPGLGASLEADSRLLKETLLSAFSADERSTEELADELVKLIKSQLKSGQ